MDAQVAPTVYPVVNRSAGRDKTNAFLELARRLPLTEHGGWYTWKPGECHVYRAHFRQTLRVLCNKVASEELGMSRKVKMVKGRASIFEEIATTRPDRKKESECESERERKTVLGLFPPLVVVCRLLLPCRLFPRNGRLPA